PAQDAHHRGPGPPQGPPCPRDPASPLHRVAARPHRLAGQVPDHGRHARQGRPHARRPLSPLPDPDHDGLREEAQRQGRRLLDHPMTGLEPTAPRRTMRSTRPLTVVALLAIAVGLLLGPPAAAGPAGKGTVTGTVTFQGKPIEGATVTVYRGGKEYYTWTNSRGKYSLKVPAGKAKVSVHSYDVDSRTTYNSNSL